MASRVSSSVVPPPGVPRLATDVGFRSKVVRQDLQDLTDGDFGDDLLGPEHRFGTIQPDVIEGLNGSGEPFASLW